VKQFILKKEPGKDNTIQLEGTDYRYLVRVRRLAVGEFFNALLPDGTETQVQILSIDNNTLIGKCAITEDLVKSFTIIPPIILFQAMPKGDKMDLIVRQAAEGGITEIVPFYSEYSIGKVKPDSQKFLRWERIIKEARQQSSSKIITTIHEPIKIAELFQYWNKLNKMKTLGLLFHHPEPKYLNAGEGLEQKSLHGYLNSVPETVVFAIGPEGGFSKKEVSIFMENNFKPITIGNEILRTETAALYCAAAIRILLLEKNSWELKQT